MSNRTNAGVGAVLDAVSAIADYAAQKTSYEADCRVREELERYRKELFEAESVKSRTTVVELAVCKTKHQLLMGKVARLPSDVRAAFDPLLRMLAERMDVLRDERRAVGHMRLSET